MWAALLPLVLWLAVIAACVYEDGMNLFQWMGCFSRALERPFSVRWTAHTLKFMMGSVFLYGCGIALYYSGRENRRPGEEYGSAKWGDPKELNRKYMNHQHKEANIILTQHVRLGMDGYITQRNMNILVVGGSGSGKTRFFCKPGVYSANCSYLITDPKGELLRASGGLLKNKGYDVKVFNLIDPSQSDCYNPFVYVHNEKDVLTLIDNLIKNTTPRNASSNDPFWEKAEIALDSALMLYLISEAPPEERNFETMLYMMNFAEVREDDDQYRSPLDMLFRALEEEQPNHVAVKQYKVFKQAAGKTAKSILVSAAVRLAAFNIPQYARMTMVDEMDFGSLGEKKRAIFCVIPIADTSMNYLVGMLYTQCFQELYHRADEKHGGRLPVPVRVIQDEWANVAQPESYPKILATCRSYNIGLNIIVQNIQNIKALYEKEWESIIGNCDTLLFLGGGNEPTSLEFIVKLLGKETLATRTRGQTKGRNGSSSTNFQQTGREYTQRVMDKLGIKADGTSFARYDAAKADEYKSKAIEELTAKGVTFPVEIDYYIKASDQTALDNANVMKQMFSDCLGDDFVTFNIKTYVSSVAKEVRNPQLASFYVNAWGADYGDPQNFLGQETYGDDNAWYSTAYSKANNITDPELLAVYQEFTAMVEKASNTTDDMDARYEAYADAEAYMLDKVITLPLYKVVSWEMTHVNDYSKIYAPYGIQINKFKNWETSVDLYTTEDYAKLAAIYEANAAK